MTATVSVLTRFLLLKTRRIGKPACPEDVFDANCPALHEQGETVRRQNTLDKLAIDLGEDLVNLNFEVAKKVASALLLKALACWQFATDPRSGTVLPASISSA